MSRVTNGEPFHPNSKLRRDQISASIILVGPNNKLLATPPIIAGSIYDEQMVNHFRIMPEVSFRITGYKVTTIPHTHDRHRDFYFRLCINGREYIHDALRYKGSYYEIERDIRIPEEFLDLGPKSEFSAWVYSSDAEEAHVNIALEGSLRRPYEN